MVVIIGSKKALTVQLGIDRDFMGQFDFDS